jgi:hypothetical protein
MWTYKLHNVAHHVDTFTAYIITKAKIIAVYENLE